MNKLFTKVAALTLGVAMAAGVGVAVGASQKASSVYADNEYELVKNVSSLSVSDKVVIASAVSGNVYTMSTTQNSNNRSANGTFTVANNKITVDSSTQVFTLGKDGDNFTFLTDSGYIYAASSSSNYLRTKTSLDDNGKWSVSITATGAATVVAQGSNTRNILKYNANNGNPIFSAYSTSGTVAIFKETTTPVGTQYDVTDSVEHGSVSPSSVNEGATLTATITPDTGYTLPETVTVTMGGTAATNTYQNGVVTVQNVTGDVVISGTCPEKQAPQPVDLPDGEYTASFPYANPFPTEIDVVDGQSAKVAALTSSISAVSTYDDTHSEYVIAANQSIEINNLTNGKISKVDIHIFQYKNFNVYVDDATDPVYTGDGKNAGNDAHIEVTTNALSKVKITGNGGDNGTRTFKVYDVKVYIVVASAPIAVEGVSLNAEEATMAVGATYNLTATVTPTGADNPAVTWSSNPTSVATVSDDGVVTAVAAGDAVVTVTTVDGGFTDTFTAHVVEVNYGSESNPLTVEEARAALDVSGAATSLQKLWVYGEVYSSSYNSQYQDYTLWLKSSDGSENEYFEIYSGSISTAITEDDTQTNALAGITVICNGYGKIHSSASSTIYELFKSNNEKPTIAKYEAPAPTLESIAVSGKYKTKYGYQAEEFDKEGIVVTATYSDQSQQPVDLKDVQFSGYNKSVLGEQTVTVTYQEKTTTFNVTVYYTATYKPGEGTPEDGEYVEYIENPDNYELVAFEKTGFVAPTGKQFKEWSQGTTGKVAVSANGNLNFTAVYEDIPVAKYSVTYKAGDGQGNDYVVPNIEAGSKHALVKFAQSEFVAPAGQQFKGWQVDNDTELRAAGYEVTVNGDVTVTAIYEDIPATDWSETFKNTFKSKFGTTYLPPFVNAEFAKESNQKWHSTYPYCKIEVEGNFYSNAATLFNNDSNWHLLGYDEYDCPIFMSHDQKAFVIIDAYVKVQDGPVYTSLTFECVGDYAVVTTGATTEYYVGDDLDLTNVKLCAKLLDGTIVENLTIPQSYWSVSPTTLTEAGDEVVITIAVAALEAEFTYNVKVTPVVMESISVSGELSKTEYAEGDAWDATGLVATAHYNNGTEADVTDQVTWSFDPAETAVEVTSVSVVAHLDELSSDAVVFDVTVEQAYGADAFAKDLLEMVAPICANYDGKKNNKVALKTVWDTMSQRYSTLSNEEKAKVIAAAAKADGTDLEKAMAFYNYACKKYGLAKFIEGRQVKALVAEHETGNSILPIVVIVASSVAAITAIGVVIALKRRKALLAK